MSKNLSTFSTLLAPDPRMGGGAEISRWGKGTPGVLDGKIARATTPSFLITGGSIRSKPDLSGIVVPPLSRVQLRVIPRSQQWRDSKWNENWRRVPKWAGLSITIFGKKWKGLGVQLKTESRGGKT